MLKSKNEKLFSLLLQNLHKSRLIKYMGYEPETITIIPGLQGTLGRHKPTYYTPDFKFKIGEQIYIIETKGFMRSADKLKCKLADIEYSRRNIKYFVITYSGKKHKNNRNWYLYKDVAIANRGQRTKTFLELILPNHFDFESGNILYEELDKLLKKQQQQKIMKEILTNTNF